MKNLTELEKELKEVYGVCIHDWEDSDVCSKCGKARKVLVVWY